MINKFVYFPPKRKEYYFSINLMDKSVAPNFIYAPFSFSTKLFWKLLLNFKIFRKFFTCEESSLPLSIKKILTILDSKEDSFQIKMGTEGPDQKMTLIKHAAKDISFFKIGNTERGIELIKNESSILKELEGKFNAPKLLNLYKKEEFEFMETEYIIGQKVNATNLCNSIYDYILSIALHNINSRDSIIKSFNHGDCCPWNFLQKGDYDFLLIDWELSGEYVLGYDLFTFIFQTPFLLTPSKSNQVILNENILWIKRFFDYFGIKNIHTYLNFFIDSKLEYELIKGKSSELTDKYLQLKAELSYLKL